MTKNTFWLSLPLCIVIALLAAFLFTTPAFAQDELPPEVVPTEAVPVEVVPTEAAPVEVLPTEAAPAEELPAEPAPVEETPAAEPGLAEVLDEAGVVITDASGEPVSLATRASGMLVTEGDPYYTVGSTTYQFFRTGGPGSCGSSLTCWYSDTPISAALQHMIDNNLTPTDRLLHIEEDTYVETVWIYGTDPGVKGLIGIKGEGNAENVIIQGNLYIGDFASGFSVSNLSVYNPSSVDDAAIWTWNNKGTLKLTDVNAQADGEDSSGIMIYHNGTVELNRVNASNNAYVGAYVENYSTGAIKITNSTFENNLLEVYDGNWYFDCSDWDVDWNCIDTDPHMVGLEVGYTPGPVNLFGVSASNNGGSGVNISAYNSAVTVKDSVFDNNDEADAVANWGDGLLISSKTISLENIQANSNNMRGIMGYANTSFTGKHTHTDNNSWSGVQVLTCFDYGDADAFCDNPGAGTVTLTNGSSSNNGEDGVSIFAKGAVTVSSFFLGGNEESGVYVDNTDSPSAPAVTITDVDVSGGATNEFDEWYKATNNGIALNIKGVATLKDISVLENANDGLHIESIGTGAITVTNASNMFNESWGNDEFGYQIVTKGPVTVTNFDVHDNGLLGGSIDNSGAASAAAVTVNLVGGPEYMNGYWYNGTGGLYIKSRGVVNVSRVAISDNLGVGLEINNIPDTLTAPGVAVTVSDSGFDRNLVIDGNSDEDGLKILSKGVVTLANIRADENDGFGVTINNMIGGSTAGVTINAATGKGNEFQWNSNSGLKIRTNGPVTITNVFANDNGNEFTTLGDGYGVDIQNDLGTGAVTIKQVGQWGVRDSWAEGNLFSNNYEYGLLIQTRGAVSVAFWQATGNGINGISIGASLGSGAVTLTGTTNYWDSLVGNGGDGLNINAKGNITVSKVRAGGNGSNGAMLVNTAGGGNVTLTDAHFEWNGFNGLVIYTNGTVSWKNGSANGNKYGAYIHDTGAGKAVTLTNVFASNNTQTGIYVKSLGAVTMTEVESNNNSANYFEAEYGQWWKDTLSNDQVWYFDGLVGEDITVEISSGRYQPWIHIYGPFGSDYGYYQDDDGDGKVTFSWVDLLQDGEYQIRIGSMNDNNKNGSYEMKLWEGTTEPSTWDNRVSAENGIYVDNSGGTGAVSIKNTGNRWMGNNSGNGVEIKSSGAVTLQGMDLNDSGEGGAWIDNIPLTGTSTPGVTLTSVNFYNNDHNSADITTRGPVTVKTSDQNGNLGIGFNVDNTAGSAISPITFTDVGVHNWGTAGAGVVLRSDGAVTLTNVTSNGNVGYGFDIAAAGAVKFTLVSGYGNSGYGAYVDTENSFTVVGSTTDRTWFTNNYYSGLYVMALGPISITKVYTGNNGWRDDITGDPISSAYGIYLQSGNTLGTAPITLSDVTSNNNTLSGLYIDTNGAVTVNTLKVENNTMWGLYLDQTGAPDSTKAIVLNLVTANNNGWDPSFLNGWDGVYVDAKGSITTNTIWALGNAASGAVLSNRNTGATGTVTMLNTLGYKTNVFVNNGYSNNMGGGVNISSNGAVTINQLETIYNALDGLDIWNNNDTLKPVVTVNNVITRENLVGMDVRSSGVVTINTSWATNNTGDGIAVHTNNNVNILNTASIMNDRSGIWVENSTGKPTLKLTGSAWFGNLRNPVIGDTNLYLTGDWNVVY